MQMPFGLFRTDVLDVRNDMIFSKKMKKQKKKG